MACPAVYSSWVLVGWNRVKPHQMRGDIWMFPFPMWHCELCAHTLEKKYTFECNGSENRAPRHPAPVGEIAVPTCPPTVTPRVADDEIPLVVVISHDQHAMTVIRSLHGAKRKLRNLVVSIQHRTHGFRTTDGSKGLKHKERWVLRKSAIVMLCSTDTLLFGAILITFLTHAKAKDAFVSKYYRCELGGETWPWGGVEGLVRDAQAQATVTDKKHEARKLWGTLGDWDVEIRRPSLQYSKPLPCDDWQFAPPLGSKKTPAAFLRTQSEYIETRG